MFKITSDQVKVMHSRRIRIQSILKNPLSQKLEVKHQNTILKMQKTKKSTKSY